MSAAGGCVPENPAKPSPVELDLRRYELRRGTRVLKLEKIPMELLILLAQKKGQLIGREEIIERLWGKDVFLDTEQGVNTAIRKIRLALGDDPEQPHFLQTVVGKGYRLIGPIVLIGGGNGTEIPSPSAETPAPLIATIVTPSSSRSGRGTIVAQASPRLNVQVRGLAVVVVVLLLVLAAGLLWWRHLGSVQPMNSLAVLPFVNASGNADLEYLGDGLNEGLINDVAQNSTLKVISRASVFHYKGRDIDPRTVGRELGVGAVLIGRIVQRGSDVSISVELVNASDNRHLWGQQYNLRISDLLTVQKQISAEITDNLRLKLSPAEATRLAHKGTSDPEAYQLFLRGRFYANQGNFEPWYKSRRYFEQAIAKDPQFADAWAGLADYFFAEAEEGCAYQPAGSDCAEMPREVAWKKSEEAAVKAVGFDDGLAEAHIAIADMYGLRDWNFPAQERELKRALQLNPNSVAALKAYSAYLRLANRIDEAIAHSKRAVELDPLEPRLRIGLAFILSFARRDDEALEQCRRALELDPGSGSAFYMMSGSYESKGMYKEAAEATLKRLRAFGEKKEKTARFERIYQAQGYWPAIHFLDASFIEEEKGRAHPAAWDVACSYARLGKKDEAFRWLERCLTERDGGILQIRSDPDVDSLRSDPRYEKLLRRIPFPQ